jgi:CRISPR-associated protein Csx14
MAECSIPVDLFNPGQVFACLGLLEAADVLLGDAQGGFGWSDVANVRFHLRAARDLSPVSAVLAFLSNAQVRALAPAGSLNSTDSIPTVNLSEDDPFPYPDPTSSATLPAVFEGRVFEEGPLQVLTIDYWGDETRRDNVKFWAGMGGYPGAAIARDALDLVRPRWRDALTDPLNFESEQSNSFRFDWRRDYIPIDAGFSLNAHGGRIAAVGFPLVEILAALGLSNARPARIEKLEYRYGVIGSAQQTPSFHDPVFLRAALGAAELPFPRRCFRMRLGWPGKEGQARAITTVTEDVIR